MGLSEITSGISRLSPGDANILVVLLLTLAPKDELYNQLPGCLRQAHYELAKLQGVLVAEDARRG